MYKYYNKNSYEIMEYNFDSITEFLEFLENTPINTAIWDINDLSSEKGDFEFCQTASLQEAKDLCKYGYHKDFDKLIELKLKLEKYIKMTNNTTKQYNYYVGYTPDIKAYLEGNPLSMFNKMNPQKKHIDIYYNSAVLSTTSTNQIFNRGAITLSIVEILESLGFSVSLNIFTMSQKEKQIHYANFNLKQNNERLNIQKLYFPLCHPSFLRRLVFRLREQTPDIKQSWTNCYGVTCDNYTVRKTIDLKDNDITICQPEEMGIIGNDIIDDANSMFNYINKYTSDDLKLERIKKLRK